MLAAVIAPGETSANRAAAHRLVYRTLPGHQVVEFVPEVGITRDSYVHHGTVAEADARLRR
jgi:hypothetical protein